MKQLRRFGMLVVLVLVSSLARGGLSSAVLAEAPVIVPQPTCLKTVSYPLTVTDPSPVNNVAGSGFPGYRASNQLIVYDQGYGKPTTGTNEFGFEVTVLNGRVVDQEGSDSLIPAENGYVLSGHGRARSWLIAHAPLGAQITLDPVTKVVTSCVNVDTYRYVLSKKLQSLEGKVDPALAGQAQAVLSQLDTLAPEKAIEAVEQTMNALNQAAWKHYNVFPNTAIRGIWHRPVETSREAVAQTIAGLKQSGLNTIFLETFFHGYPIYPSPLYHLYGIAENQNPKFKGWDPLAVWVEEAHRQGMQLHVWFQSFYVGTNSFHGPGPILTKYPEWANVQYSALPPSVLMGSQKLIPSTLEPGAYFADQANPDAQTFLLRLIDEIVSQYKIDGFQLDYMDYPLSFPPNRFSYLKTTWGYTPVARKLFQAKTGVDPVTLTPDQTELWQAWSMFKEEQVNQFVQRASALIHERKPAVKVSATIFAKLIESKTKKHEDWALWATQGWVDFLAPMLLTSSVKVVHQDTAFVLSHSQNRVPVVAGLFGPFNGSGPDILMDQVWEAHRAGAQGFSVFDTAHLTEKHRAALQQTFGTTP